MNFNNLVNSLERFPSVLTALTSRLDEETIRWKPQPENWSIVEVVCHLADEEVEDFRPRLQMTLTNPQKAWTPIDPEGAAIARGYAKSSLADAVQRFVYERKCSIDWLRRLQQPKLQQPEWENAYDHPEFGLIKAGEIMTAWVAHDHLHTRQIAKRLFEKSAQEGSPFSTRYAGDW